MQNIQESFFKTRTLRETVESQMVDEGFKEVFQSIKDKFKAAFEYLKGIVAKVGVYFIPVSKEGNILPAISPLTAGQAYKDGFINTSNTLVVLDRAGSRITGLKTKFKDAFKLYGSGNSISYWQQLLKESDESKDINWNQIINEVKLHTDDPQAKYNIIVDDGELKTEIKMRLKNKKLAPLLIWGAPGIGKTAILRSVLDEMQKDFPDYRLIVKTLSNETPDNFTLPMYVDIDGQRKADDVPKTWLPVYKPTGDPKTDAELDAACGNGLLFIDELSRATPQVLNVILPLVNEKIFNGYHLGSGWVIICASNRAEDEMAGQTAIGNALANRFAQLHYEPTVKTWRKWADKQGFISPLLLQWLSMPESENMSGGKFYYMDPNETMEDANPTTLMCTPRAWTNAMQKLAMYSHTGSLEGFTIFDIPTNIIGRALNQEIPSVAVDSFLAFLQVIKGIGDFDHVVYDVWQNGGKGTKIDKKVLNQVALPLAQLVCSAHSDKLPTTEEFENLATWLVAQDSDQLASYTLDVFKNVFMGMMSEQIQPAMFTVGKKIKASNAQDPKLEIYKSAGHQFFSKWGVKFEDMTKHDFMVGLQILSKKYRDAFKSAIVDGHEDALG